MPTDPTGPTYGRVAWCSVEYAASWYGVHVSAHGWVAGGGHAWVAIPSLAGHLASSSPALARSLLCQIASPFASAQGVGREKERERAPSRIRRGRGTLKTSQGSLACLEAVVEAMICIDRRHA